MSESEDKFHSSHATRRRWLCVAFAFPPVNRSGTHRTVGFVRHLFTRGWDATVLTAIPDGESIDKTLSDRVPSSTRIVQTRCGDLVALLKRILFVGRPGKSDAGQCCKSDAGRGGGRSTDAKSRRGLREWVSQLLQTPDSRIGWIPSTVWSGVAAIRRDKPEVIYSTSPYVSAHLVAMVLAWWTKIPWVADFRDPWGDNPFRKFTFTSVERLDSWLERLVLRRASHIVMNTATARRALCERMPSVAGNCSTITNGIDFDLLRCVEAERVVPESCFAITHCGQFYGPRSPQPWFDALREIRAADPDLASRIRFILVGPETFEGQKLCEIASDAGVGDLIVVTGPKSHAEALSIMAGSDALALATNVGPGSELQIPNKLFEYLGLGKPIVAAIDERSPGRTILERAGSCVSICKPGDVTSLASALRERAVLAGSDHMVAKHAAVLKLDRAKQADALGRIFDHVTNCEANDWVRSSLDSVEHEGVGCSLSLDGGFGTVST